MKSLQTACNLMRKGKKGAAAYIKANLDTSTDVLPDFLDYYLAPVRHINDSDTIEWCKWLMAGGQTPEDFANEVKQYDNATTCGLVWTANFVAYRCRTCGISPCMSLCAECFQRGNHEGHDFNMFRSQAGGACDCGDPSVMKESGFCGRHGPQAHEQKPTAPEELMLLPHSVMPRLIFRLIQHMRENSNLPKTVTKEAEAFLNMLHDFSAMGAAMRRVMTQALTDSQVYKELTEWSHPSADPELSYTMLSTTQIYQKALRSLQNPEPPDEYKDCPSLQEQLVHKTFLEELMFWTVKLEFPQEIVCLLLNMLPDPDYKEPLTRAFVLHYSRIPMMLERSDSPDTLSNRVVHVSVQLFSNESLALKMTQQLSLLHVMVVSLKYMMTKILIPNSLHDGNKNFHQVVDCGQQVMREHCYWPLVSDLNNVLSHKPVALQFMSDNNLLEMWFAFLSMFQGMNVNIRELYQHVEFEPSTYYAAFSAELEASAYPMWALVSHLKDPSTLDLTKSVLSSCVTALQDWFDAINFTHPVTTDLKQVSFHLPLHRYLAVLMAQAVKCQGVTLKEVLPPADILELVYQHPLRLQVAFYEILNGMWVRNGLQIKGQMMTYIQCNFCNSMVDADLYLLQVCAVQTEPDKFLMNVLEMFRVLDALSVRNPTYFDYEFEPAMLESCLTFLATLIDIRTNLGVSDTWLSKLEMVTLLCMGDKTHSQLIELMPERCGTGQNRDLDALLAEVADYRAPSNMQQGMYSPRPHVWEELYDPVNVLLRAVHRRDFQTSMDRFTEYVQQTRKVKPGSGNVWPPLRPPAACGDPYDDPRKILQSRIFHAVIFSILYKAIDKQNVSEHVLALALYLLEMAVMSSPPPSQTQVYQEDRCIQPEATDGVLSSFYKTDWLSLNLRTVIQYLILADGPETAECVEMDPDVDGTDMSQDASSEGEASAVPLPSLDLILFDQEAGGGVPGAMALPALPSTSQDSQLVPAANQPVQTVQAGPGPLTHLRHIGSLPSSTQPGSSSSQPSTSSTMLPLVAARSRPRRISSLRSITMRSQMYPTPGSHMLSNTQGTQTQTRPDLWQWQWQFMYRPLEMGAANSTDMVASTSESGGTRKKLMYKDGALVTNHSSEEGSESRLAMPVNENIISLLLRLHAQLSGNPDTYVLGQQANDGLLESRIGDGPFFVAKVLDRIANLDDRCRDCIRETKEALWPKRAEEEGTEAKAREAKEREERRRRAKERQQKLMEEFATKQKQFMENLETEDCENMEWNDDNGSQIKSEYDCVICNQTTPSTLDKPMGLVVLVQATSVLARKRKCDAEEMLPTTEEERRNLQKEDTLASEFERRLEELKNSFDTYSWLLAVNIGWEGGVHVQTCGHHLHLDCLKAYLQSLRGQLRQQSLVAVDRGEYSCPLCRQLANSVLPLAPELGEVTSVVRARPPNLHTQVQSIVSLLRNCHITPQPSSLSEAMGKSMDDMTNSTPFKYKKRTDGSSSQGMVLFCSSIVRTNLEIEIDQKGGSFLSKITESSLIPKRSCIVPLLHVIALHVRIVAEWPMWQTWQQLAQLPRDESNTQVAIIEREVPLLLRDPTALLIQFLLYLPLNLDQSYFSCIVKCMYNLLYFQVLCQVSVNMTECERQTWRDPQAKSCSEVKTLDMGLGFVTSQLEESCLYMECGGSASPSSPSPPADRQNVETRVQSMCLPFLRVAALLRHHLFNEEIPQVRSEQTEFVRLVYYLELVTEGMEWSKFNAAVGVTFCEEGLALPRLWFRQLSSLAERSQHTAHSLITKMHITWHPPRLLSLPQLYDRIFQFYHKRQCSQCHSVPREASVCLLCGTLVCLKEVCCKASSVCEAVQHSFDCGAGTSMFLVVTSSYVIVIRGKRACLWGSVYLDSFGEEDRELKRGKPLFLCPERYQLLQEQWLTHRFDHTNKKWVWHRDAL